MTSNTPFDLDVCQGCKSKYPITDINAINSCCSETAAAFAGESSLNALIGTSAGKSCEACLNESKAALGKSTCDLRLTNAAIWTQVPHYFPGLFSESGNKDKALQQCYAKCQENSTYPQECVERCEIDYASVVTPENYGTGSRNNPRNRQIDDRDYGDLGCPDTQYNLILGRDPGVIKEGFTNPFRCQGEKCKSQNMTYIVVGILMLIALIAFLILKK
jgi:hypothetical protein